MEIRTRKFCQSLKGFSQSRRTLICGAVSTKLVLAEKAYPVGVEQKGVKVDSFGIEESLKESLKKLKNRFLFWILARQTRHADGSWAIDPKNAETQQIANAIIYYKAALQCKGMEDVRERKLLLILIQTYMEKG